MACFVAGYFGRFCRLGLVALTLLTSALEGRAAAPTPTTATRELTPFWRNRPVLGFALKAGNGVAPVPEYLLATATPTAPDFAYGARPYGTEVLWADNLFVVRPLGGWNPAKLVGEQLEYGNGSTSADLCFKNQDGTLGYRWNLLAPRLSPYSAIGYTGEALTYILDNTPWDLPTTPTLDAGGLYGQSSPPADMNQWSTFIQGFAQQLVSLNIAKESDAVRFRQGTECNFADRFNGTQTQYNAQYAASATAVKSVFPNAQFGPFNITPGSNQVTHTALATYCKANNLPFDFAAISFYELANTEPNKFIDTDTYWTNATTGWSTIETTLGHSVSREIHEFGFLYNEHGLSTAEPGSWGAAWSFNILMKLYATGLQRSAHWDPTEVIAGNAKNPTISALRGDGWVYTVLDSMVGGQWTYLTPPAASPAGTKYTSVCVTKGNRVYVVVSAVNVVTAGGAARSLDSRSITVSVPKSAATLGDSRTVRYTALTRSTSLYDLIRADLDAQHPEYFVNDTVTGINWSTVPGLTANVFTMAGASGKTWVANNWTTGENYRQKVIDSLTLKTFNGTITTQSDTYNVTFPMENAAVMVIAIDNLPTISIAATDPTAAEPGTDTGLFTVTRSSGATWATTVNLAFTGTATHGSDYTTLATTLTFAAGETSKTLTVTPIDDGLAESAETVIATLAAGSGYTIASSPADTATVTLADNLTRVTPSITAAPTASSITYGQTLASSTLSSGSASVAGTFAFTTPSTAPTAGTALQSYTFTPTDAANTNSVTGTVSVTVAQAISVVTAPTASSILVGQTLAASTLSGGNSSVSGTFAFTTPSTTPGVGTSSQAVTFTPTDTVNYTTASTATNVTVIATGTWTGGGADTNWNTGANWGGTAPVAGNRLAFAGTTRVVNINNFTADTTFAGLHFTNDPGVTAGNFTLSGSRIILGGDIVTTGNATIGNNSATLSLALALSGNRTLTANTKHTLTISGNMTETGGARSLTKEGAANLTLSGSNTFSGGLILNTGTVTVTKPAALGTGPLGLATTGNAVALTFATTGGTVGNAINWGSGNVTIGASQGNATALVVANAGFTSVGGNKTLTLQGASAAANDFQSLIPDGAGNTVVAMNGAGSWKLSHDSNAFSGQLQVLQGTLTITSLANIGSVSAAGTGAVNSVIRLGSGTGDGALNYIGSGNVTSDRSVQLGNGNTATYTGGAKVTNNGVGSMIFTAASFNPVATTGTPARTLTLGGANTGANEISGIIQNIADTGPVSVSKINTGCWTLSGNNTYTGNTTVSNGTLQLAKVASLYNGTVANWIGAKIKVASGATLAVNVGGANEFTAGDITTLLTNLGGANGGSTAGFAAGAAIGFDTTSAANGTHTVADIIANSSGAGGGAMGVTKLGTNTLVLSGNNTYSGITAVNSGTLSLSRACLATAANVSLATGAVLDLNYIGNNTINSLIIGGAQQYQGTWGSLTSGAARKTAAITGTGLLNVTAGPVETPVTVTLLNLSQTYDGSPKAVSATTSPQAELAVSITYSGSSIAPTAAGSYSVVATVTTSGYIGTASGTLVIVAGFNGWTSDYGLSGAGALASADPDGDGLLNLVEYALGLTPSVSNANPITLSQVTVNGSSYLQLSVSRDPSVTNVLFEGLSAGTLTDANAWSAATTVNDPNNTTSVFTVRDSVPMSTTGSRFLRLRFTLQP